MNCQSCGATLNAGLTFCTHCGARVTRDAGYIDAGAGYPALHSPSPAPANTQTATIAPMPSEIRTAQLNDTPVRLAHGEMVKKTFTIGGAVKGLGQLRGELVVTDARVIYRAHAKTVFGESRNCRELQIQDVNGVALVTRRGLTPLSLLTILAGTAIGLLVMQWLVTPALEFLFYRMGVYDLDGIGILANLLVIAIGIIMIVVRVRSTEVVFALFARSVEASPISLAGTSGRQNPGLMAITVAVVGRPLLGLLRWLGVMDASDASDEANLADTQRMYDEIGALILDIQNRGVLSMSD